MQAAALCDTLFESAAFKDGFQITIGNLQILHSFLNTSVGRSALADTLSQGRLLLKCIEVIKFSYDDSLLQMDRLVYAAARGYLIDTTVFTIKHTSNIEFLRKVFWIINCF